MSVQRLLCLVGLFLTVQCKTIPVEENDEGDSSRIVNGHLATAGQFPFAVSLQTMDPQGQTRRHICTLSIITKKTCLGSAHCIVDENGSKTPATNLCGIVGSTEQSSKSTCHMYSNVIPHENYVPKPGLDDIALFIFEKEIQLDNKNVDTIVLMESTKFNPKALIALGWGNLHSTNDEKSPLRLRYVEMSTLPLEQCSEEKTSNRICLSTPGKGVCSGDSGGPNIVTLSEKNVQVAISTAVHEECAVKTSIATEVAPYKEWIKKNAVGEPKFVTE